jgi:hypothetical protein
MRDFGTWFAEQGKEPVEEIDESVYLECTGCGKTEFVERRELENGDAWATFDESAGTGLCGGSHRCVP